MRLVSKKGVRIFREFYIDIDIKPPVIPKIAKIPTACDCAVTWKKTIGDHIEKYEVIAILKNGIPVYSPFAGIFKQIVFGPGQGDIGSMQYAVIEVKKDNASVFLMWDCSHSLRHGELCEIVKKAAIIDELRKCFLAETLKTNTEYKELIIDCVDEQPYDLSETAVALQYENEVLGGAEIIAQALNIPKTERLAIKNFRTVDMFKNSPVRTVSVCGKYPMLPRIMQYVSERNALRLGAQTLRAVYRSVYFSEPQLSHVVTVWGAGVKEPANIEVYNGTPICDLIESCSVFGMIERVVSGGVMTGYTASTEFPMLRWDGSLNVMPIKKHHNVQACINCGRCAMVCPVGLAPYYMLRSSRRKGEKKAKQLCAGMCIFCGACSYICPARIPLNNIIKEYNLNLKEES